MFSEVLSFIVGFLILVVAVIAVYSIVHSLMQIPETPTTGVTRSRTIQR